ncbi:PREDICTED: probable disease resistance protein RXW24L [Camelina sativa]|uniref:Probable disease resistance protein RXW24L n=1 Tax=Camelina sativa TaxID=90675 RepID=A0ABM0Z6E5_CAMSA|nr:PREDICTED: probable disease resistance protein RXW24L [Camelina sativa]
MAGTFVSFGVQKLWDLLSREHEQLQGVDDHVTELKNDLNFLSTFLKDADAKKHTSAAVKICIGEIKEIIFDAEDIIETFILRQKLGKTSGINTRIRRLTCIVPKSRELAYDIGGIRKKISKVIRDMKSFGIQQIISDGGYMQPLFYQLREMRDTFPRDCKENLVGLGENVQKLVGYLVEDDNIQVVSMTGMRGVGKTTLARQVFNHEMVKQQFDGFAWVCVSQEPLLEHVWQTILLNLKSGENVDKIMKMTKSKLRDELYLLLETSKFLIVLDDISKEEDWDLIKQAFPPNKDWKVLLTYRKESFALREDKAYINFEVECLSPENSWTLFQNIAFPEADASEFKEDGEIKELAKKLIIPCGGLPLAVKVLGSLLAAQHTLHDWKGVCESIESDIVGRTNFNEDTNNLVYHLLSLSFEELPSYLKHCLLYLVNVPDGFVMEVEETSYYWAAEAIIKLRCYDEASIPDIAECFLEELVRRNMVTAERDNDTSRIKSFYINAMMKEVCFSKAEEENLLQRVGRPTSTTTCSQSPCTSRRLVICQPTTLDDVEPEIKNPKLRSFMVFYGWGKGWMPSGLNFSRLQLIRVLNLSGAKFKEGKLPSSIGKLIHLRYLNLENAEVTHLPPSLRNLKLLIYLNLGVSSRSRINVPNCLMWMPELRYLVLPYKMLGTTMLELSNLVNLEFLRNFSTKATSVGDLHCMKRLRLLVLVYFGGCSMETLSASLGSLRNLETLMVLDVKDNSSKCDSGAFILKCFSLYSLHLSIHTPRLPNEENFSSHLKRVDLNRCFLEEDQMSVLEKCPHLEYLHLGTRALSGRRMVCLAGGFPQLLELHLDEQSKLEEWIVEEGSMPLLHTLRIHRCEMLKALPDGLRYITSLKILRIVYMGRGWTDRLSKGGEDYYKVQHIPHVRFMEES